MGNSPTRGVTFSRADRSADGDAERERLATDIDRSLADDADADTLRRHTRLSAETPPVLQMLGVEAKPVVTSLAVLRKMHDAHGVTPNVLRRLPDLLADPVMVLKSRTQPGRLVVVTDEPIGGRPLVLAVEPDGSADRVRVVFVPSAYQEDGGADSFVRDIREGGVLYANKAKSRQLATTTRLQLPGVVQRAVGFSVAEYATATLFVGSGDCPQGGEFPTRGVFSRATAIKAAGLARPIACA